MTKTKPIVLTALILMAALSLTNLVGISASGTTVLVGIVVFFLNKMLLKRSYEQSGLDIKSVGRCLKGRPSVWFWLFMPLIMNAVCVFLAKAFVPEFLDHVMSRSGVAISFVNILLTIVQLAIMALGEEIAWRAFFQNELQGFASGVPSLLITSLLFALAHYASGEPVVVIYDIFFVFVNSILYGIVFMKTKNAWLSAISHFIANVFCVVILMII